MQTLTKEQRDQLPQILAAIGPSTIPGCCAICTIRTNTFGRLVATLGHLHALDCVDRMVALVDDSSDMVRQSLAEALGSVGGISLRRCDFAACGRRIQAVLEKLRWLKRWKAARAETGPARINASRRSALQTALSDSSTTVRSQAAISLGMIGSPARALVPDLTGLLHDADETVRCQQRGGWARSMATKRPRLPH